MKKVGRVLSFVLIVVMVFVLAACSQATTEEPAAEEEASAAEAPAEEDPSTKAPAEAEEPASGESEEEVSTDNSDLTFGLSIHYLFDDWGKVCSEAFEQRCEELGINYEVLNGENDAEKQLNDVQSFYTREFDAIAINPVDTKTLSSIGNELYEAEVPFIAVTDQDDYPVFGYVDGGQWDKCNASGQMMAEDLGGEGKVILYKTASFPTLMEARTQGMMDAIEGTNIEIIDTKLGETFEDFINLTNDILTSGVEFDAFYTLNGSSTQGCLTALKAAGRKDIPVYGMDAEYAVMQMMAEGYGTGITAQFPSDTAVTLVDYMLELCRGTYDGDGVVVEPRIREVVTQDNVEEMCLEVWKKPLEESGAAGGS